MQGVRDGFLAYLGFKMDPYLKKCLPVIRRPFVNFPLLHCHPYSWLKETDLPVTLDQTWGRIHFYVNFGLCMSYTFFVICRTDQIYSDPAASLVDKFYLAFMSAIYLGMTNFCVAAVRSRNTFVPFLRRYIRFLRNVENAGQTCTTSSPNRVKLCWLLTMSSFNSFWLVLVAIAALNVVRPSSPEFFSSLFLSSVQQEGESIWLRAMVTLMSSTFQVYVLICYVQVLEPIFGPILLFMFTLSDITGGQKQCKLGACSNRLEAIQNAGIKLYRELQLLTDEYNNLLALFHAVQHGILVTFLTLCVYIFVRTEGIMAALAAYMGIWLLPCYCEIINNYAEIQIGSRTFLESLQETVPVRRSRIWIRTGRAGSVAAIIRGELRSLRELHIKGGSSAFYFDKQLVLTVIHIIVNQSISLLLIT